MPNLKKRFLSRYHSSKIFRNLFYGFMLVPLIPGLMLQYFSYKAQDRAMDIVSREITQSSLSITDGVNAWVDKNISLANYVAALPDVTEFDKAEAEKLLILAKQAIPTTIAIRVDDATGQAIARSDGETLKNYADRPYFEMVKMGEPVGHSVIMGRTQNKPLLCFAVPIKHQIDFKGVVTQCAGLDDITAKVSNFNIGETGFAFLVDENGKVIASGRPTSALATELVDLSTDPVLNNSRLNEITRLSFADIDVVSYKQQVGLNWTLVIQQDYDEAFSDVIALQREAWVTILLTLLISIIVVIFLSRLIAKPLQKARDETDNILKSTRDGLFLIDRNFTIGTQISSNLPSILKVDNPAGANFIDYLTRNVPSNVSSLAKTYMDLLFTKRIKEQLIETQNPLANSAGVQVSVQDSNGYMNVSYLHFIFKRIYDDNKDIIGLLVTARDETKNVELKKQIELLNEDKAKQINLLSDILHVDHTQLTDFIRETKLQLININEILEKPGSGSAVFQKKISMMYQIMHKIKSDAVSIDFDLFVSVSHKFEDGLSALKSNSATTGDTFLPLTMELDELFKLIAMIEELVDKLSSMRNFHIDRRSLPANAVPDEWETVNQLATTLAEKYNKPVELHWKGFNYELPAIPTDVQSALQTVTKQFLRNTFVHGLESPTVRKKRIKLPQGQITLSIRPAEFGLIFTFQDDGQGINYDKMRQSLVKMNRCSREDAALLDEAYLNNLLLTTDMSTADMTTVDAGRGVGMQLVHQQVAAIGGKIIIKTIAGKGTIFIIKIPLRQQIAA